MEWVLEWDGKVRREIWGEINSANVKGSRSLDPESVDMKLDLKELKHRQGFTKGLLLKQEGRHSTLESVRIDATKDKGVQLLWHLQWRQSLLKLSHVEMAF